MRRLSIPVVLILLMTLAIPAWAAKPTTTHQIVWNLDGGTLTLDTLTEEVTVTIEEQMTIECFAGNAVVTVRISGTATADVVSIDRRGMAGSFELTTFEYTPEVIFGACPYTGGPLMTSLSGDFEANKGKADRWRDETARYVRRNGTGVASMGSMQGASVEVTVTATITR